MTATSDSSRDRVRAALLESAELQKRTAEECTDSILAAADLMTEVFRSGGKILLCGNGGSAADCQHVATELVSRLTKEFERPGLPAVALTTDTSFLTAFANDCGFDGVFARQVQALGKPGDLLIAISTSGNSPNVIRAVEVASEAGLRSVSLTGKDGRLAGLVDVAISVPSTDTQHIQETHLAVEHILCELVELPTQLGHFVTIGNAETFQSGSDLGVELAAKLLPLALSLFLDLPELLFAPGLKPLPLLHQVSEGLGAPLLCHGHGSKARKPHPVC